MIAIDAFKDLGAFGMSYGGLPWLLKHGWETTWGGATGICARVIL